MKWCTNDLIDLNKLLDEFYSKHATITALEEWLDQNEYHEAADDASADWVGKWSVVGSWVNRVESKLQPGQVGIIMEKKTTPERKFY